MRRKANPDPLAAREPTEHALAIALERYLAYNAKLYYHTYDSRRSAPGFPDYVIVDAAGVLFLELKAKAGRLGLAQRVWLDHLARAGERACVVQGMAGLDAFLAEHVKNPAGITSPAGLWRTFD